MSPTYFNTLRRKSISAVVQSRFKYRNCSTGPLQKIISKISSKSGEEPPSGLLIEVISPSFIYSTPLVERCSHAHRELASISTEQGHFSLSKHHSHCYIVEITITDHLALACSPVQIWSWIHFMVTQKAVKRPVSWLPAILTFFSCAGSLCFWLEAMKHYFTIDDRGSDSGELNISIDTDISAHKWN